MPPSSLYWIQKSASGSSSAAGKRSSAASPSERLPLASAVRMLLNSPAPTVPAPKAIVLPRKERRLMDRFRGLILFSKLSSTGRISSLLEPFAVGSLIVFMSVESQRFVLRAAREKLHVCYPTRRYRFRVVNARCFRLIDRHFGLRSEYASDCEHLGLGGSLKGENICVIGPDVSQFSTASVGATFLRGHASGD